jgi:hypothetical protein
MARVRGRCRRRHHGRLADGRRNGLAAATGAHPPGTGAVPGGHAAADIGAFALDDDEDLWRGRKIGDLDLGEMAEGGQSLAGAATPHAVDFARFELGLNCNDQPFWPNRHGTWPGR